MSPHKDRLTRVCVIWKEKKDFLTLSLALRIWEWLDYLFCSEYFWASCQHQNKFLWLTWSTSSPQVTNSNICHILNSLIRLNGSILRFPDCDEPYPRPEDLLTGSDPTNQSSLTVQRDYGFWCPRELKVDTDLGYTFMGKKDCSAPCPSMYFSQQELTFIRYIIGVTSLICLSATLFTFLTFLIDVTRFELLNLAELGH